MKPYGATPTSSIQQRNWSRQSSVVSSVSDGFSSLFFWQTPGYCGDVRCSGQRCCVMDPLDGDEDSDAVILRQPHADFDDPYRECVAHRMPDSIGSRRKPSQSMPALSDMPLPPGMPSENSFLPWASLSRQNPQEPLQEFAQQSPESRAPWPADYGVSTGRSRPVRERSPEPRINPVTGFITLTTPASKYSSDISDPMDVAVARCMHSNLDVSSLAVLSVRRLAKGCYEFDGTCVTVSWSGTSTSDLMVHEGLQSSAPDNTTALVPLPEYLCTAAKIALDVHVSNPRTLTFDIEGRNILNASEEERINSMVAACKQANARLAAAEGLRAV